MLLHFVELAGQDGRGGVLLAVHRLLLHGRVQLGEGHGRGVGAERVEAVDEQLVLDHADLEAGEVFGLVDRAARVGGLAEAVLPVAQADQALLGQFGEQLLAESAVEHGVGFLAGIERERQVEHAEVLDHRHQGGAVGHRHFQRAAAQRGDHGDVVAQRAVGEELGAQLAAAPGRQHLVEVPRGLGLRMVVGDAGADLEGALAHLRHGRRGQHGRQGSGQRERLEGCVELHDVLSPVDVLGCRGGAD